MIYENKNLYIKKNELNEIEKINNLKIDSNIAYEIYNKNINNIERIQKYFNLINYKYPIEYLNNNIIEDKLNISVKTTMDAIKIINSINLFKYIFNTNSKEKKDLKIPINYSYLMLLDSDEEAKSILENKTNKDNYVCEHKSSYRNLIEVYSKKEAFFRISFNKERKEYYIAIYNSKESENYIKYNFIDFYAILSNISKKEAIVKLMNLLKIEVTDVKEILKIYNDNLKTLNTLRNLNGDMYRNLCHLYTIIQKHIYALEEIINIALIECYFYNENKKIGYIFFSLSFLANRLNKSQSVISNYVNGFCLLGFIEKKKLDEKNIVYKINLFNYELITNANKIARKMKSKETVIKFSSITKRNISKLFGEEIANSIFLT